MLVYHGSTAPIENPDLGHGRLVVDFGRGFYCTKLQNQAEKWSIRQAARLNAISDTDFKPVVSVYEFDNTRLGMLNYKEFDGYSKEWLEFVAQNRFESPAVETFDVVFGNIADDDVARTVEEYIELRNTGKIDDEATRFFLKQLSFSEPNDQYCFSTLGALDLIQFASSYEVEVS